MKRKSAGILTAAALLVGASVLVTVEGEGASFHGMWETDSGGRMRIVAPPGRYRIRHYGGPEVELKVDRETAVRMTVPFKGPAEEVLTELPR